MCESCPPHTPGRKNKAPLVLEWTWAGCPLVMTYWRQHCTVVNKWSQKGLSFKSQLQSWLVSGNTPTLSVPVFLALKWELLSTSQVIIRIKRLYLKHLKKCLAYSKPVLAMIIITVTEFYYTKQTWNY